MERKEVVQELVEISQHLQESQKYSVQIQLAKDKNLKLPNYIKNLPYEEGLLIYFFYTSIINIG